MKQTTLFIALILISFQLAAQKTHNICYSNNATELSKHDGKAFRYSAMAKKEAGSGEGFMVLWFRVDRADGTMGFFDNMWDRPIKASEWKRYTIEGTIDEGVKKLNYGVLFVDQGNFSLDDVRFEIQNEKGVWESIPLENSGFEKIADTDKVPGWSFRFEQANSFTKQIGSKGSPEGKQHLMVEGLLPFRSNSFFSTGNNFVGYWQDQDEKQGITAIKWNADSSYLDMSSYEQDGRLSNSSAILYDEPTNTVYITLPLRKPAVFSGSLEDGKMIFKGSQEVEDMKEFDRVDIEFKMKLENDELIWSYSSKTYLKGEFQKEQGPNTSKAIRVKKPDFIK